MKPLAAYVLPNYCLKTLFLLCASPVCSWRSFASSLAVFAWGLPGYLPENAAEIKRVFKPKLLGNLINLIFPAGEKLLCAFNFGIGRILHKIRGSAAREKPAKVIGGKAEYCGHIARSQPLVEVRVDVGLHILYHKLLVIDPAGAERLAKSAAQMVNPVQHARGGSLAVKALVAAGVILEDPGEDFIAVAKWIKNCRFGRKSAGFFWTNEAGKNMAAFRPFFCMDRSPSVP